MGDPTSSYATAGIALRVSGALKPHHHDKVETPSAGIRRSYGFYLIRPPSLDIVLFKKKSPLRDTKIAIPLSLNRFHLK
jgi:hypothetical protein